MKPEYLAIDQKRWHLIKFQLLVHSRISNADSNRESLPSFTLGGSLRENFFPAPPSFGVVAASKPRRRWVDNIRTDLQEVGCGFMDWIGLAQNRDRWRKLVSAVMNLQVP